VVGRRVIEQCRRDRVGADGHAVGEVRSHFGLHSAAALGDRKVSARAFDRQIPVTVSDGVSEFERGRRGCRPVVDSREVEDHRLDGRQRDDDETALCREDVAVAQLATDDDADVGTVLRARPDARAAPLGVIERDGQGVRVDVSCDVRVVEGTEEFVRDQHHCLLSAGAPTPSKSARALSQAVCSRSVTGSAR